MRSVALVAVGFVQAVAGSVEAQDGWQVVPVFDEQGLTVRIRVKEEANASDAGWLVLEFVNGGKEPLTVTNAYYRIEAEHDDLETRERRGSGGLASGNTFDLFPEAWETSRVAPIVLKPGEPYRVVDQPSDNSTALLCSHAALMGPGLGVRAALHLRLEASGRVWGTPHDGVAFAFDWLPPDAAGVVAMRRRLDGMLAEPTRTFHQDELLRVYLDFPEVADGVTRDQLLAALGRREDRRRMVIVSHLGKRFGADPAVRAYYLGALEAGDQAAVDDLFIHVEMWDPSFVAPLADLFTNDPIWYQNGLRALHRHRADWVADQALARRLSAAVLGKNPLLREKVAELTPEQLSLWAMQVSQLALTGDKAVIARLQPVLDDARSYARLEDMAFAMGMLPPPTRACDAALDAILTLLDGGVDAAYLEAGLGGGVPARDSEAVAKVRDGMITALKKRLNER